MESFSPIPRTDISVSYTHLQRRLQTALHRAGRRRHDAGTEEDRADAPDPQRLLHGSRNRRKPGRLGRRTEGAAGPRAFTVSYTHLYEGPRSYFKICNSNYEPIIKIVPMA